MIVLDANILIRAVLGRRVRQLLEAYAAQGVRFFAPEIAFDDARTHLPILLRKRGKSDLDFPKTIEYLQSLVETVESDVYATQERDARNRLRGRDEADWPVLAAALALAAESHKPLIPRAFQPVMSFFHVAPKVHWNFCVRTLVLCVFPTEPFPSTMNLKVESSPRHAKSFRSSAQQPSKSHGPCRLSRP